jgi:hypothetical protein
MRRATFHWGWVTETASVARVGGRLSEVDPPPGCLGLARTDRLPCFRSKTGGR